MACGCLQTQSPPLPNSVAGTLGNAIGRDPCATPSFPGIPDRQNHPATESTPDTQCSLPRSKTTPETPQTSEETGFSMSPSHQRHYPLGSLESISHPDFILRYLQAGRRFAPSAIFPPLYVFPLARRPRLHAVALRCHPGGTPVRLPCSALKLLRLRHLWCNCCLCSVTMCFL